jgi:hypothetical protein
VLATRGWGRDEFRYASPAFLATVRHALFAESGVRILDIARDNLAEAQRAAGGSLAQKGEAMKVRVSSTKAMNDVRKALDLDG